MPYSLLSQEQGNARERRECRKGARKLRKWAGWYVMDMVWLELLDIVMKAVLKFAWNSVLIIATYCRWSEYRFFPFFFFLHFTGNAVKQSIRKWMWIYCQSRPSTLLFPLSFFPSSQWLHYFRSTLCISVLLRAFIFLFPAIQTGVLYKIL